MDEPGARAARRDLVSLLRSRIPGERRFLWRRYHLVLPAGRADRGAVASHAPGSLFMAVHVRDHDIAAAFNRLTESLAGQWLHATLLLYPTAACLPNVPSYPEPIFDLEIEPAREARDRDAPDIAAQFANDCAVLEAHAWGRTRLEGLRRVEPRLVAMRSGPLDADPIDHVWHVADQRGWSIFIDGNLRVRLSGFGNDPLAYPRYCGDLGGVADALDWL